MVAKLETQTSEGQADLRQQLIQIVKAYGPKSLEEARRGLERYCVRCRAKNVTICYGINWSAVDRVYACAVFKSEVQDYSYRLFVLPGAVIYYATKGPNSWCYAAGELAAAEDILRGLFSEIYIFQDGDVEKPRRYACAAER
jgi:hypothetical protein